LKLPKPPPVIRPRRKRRKRRPPRRPHPAGRRGGMSGGEVVYGVPGKSEGKRQCCAPGVGRLRGRVPFRGAA
jgi:hypothetical protein